MPIKSKFKISEIPDMDASEFTVFRSAKRTGDYVSHYAEDGILYVKEDYTGLDFAAVGITRNPKVLSSGDEQWVRSAIMFQSKTEEDHLTWSHSEA